MNDAKNENVVTGRACWKIQKALLNLRRRVYGKISIDTTLCRMQMQTTILA